MDHKQLCEKFIAADMFYDGKNANITLEEIKKKQGFEEYCRNQTCDTRKKIIGALSAYLFMKTRGGIYGQYDEFFLMWLSDKLFEIVRDEGKAQSKDITLNEAYDKYLKNNIKNGSYWSLLDSTKGLKEANLKYMKDFYKLLNHICSTILDYKNNGADSMSLLQNSTNCSNQYMSLYKNIYRCKSYLHLLDNLKKIYYNFRDSAISENEKKKKKLAISLQTLTKPNGEDLFFTNNFKAFDFSRSECKPKKPKKPSPPKKEQQPPLQLHSKETGPPPPPQPSNLPKDNQDEKPPSPPPPLQPLTSSQNSNELQKSKTGELSHQNGSEDSKSKQQDSENSKRNTGDTPGNKGNPNSEKGSSEGGSGDGSSDRGSPGGGSSGDAGGTGNNQGGTGSGTVGGSDNGPGAGLGSVQGGASGGSGINHQGTNDGTGSQGSIDSGSGSQRGTGNGTGDGAKESGNQDATNSSGTSNEDWLGNLGMNLNLTGYMPSVSGIYESSKDILTNTANQITSAYNSAVTTVKDTYDITMTAVKDTYDSAVTAVKNTYDNTVTTIKGAYTTSTNYISGAVSSITNQLSSLGSFSQLGNDQSELGGPGNSLPTDNKLPSTTQTPKSDPNSLPPSLPQSQSPPITSPQLQTPSQLQSNQTQDSTQTQTNQTQDLSQGPSSPKKPISPHVSQDTLQNDASSIVQQPDPNTGAGGVQTLPITQVTLPNSITDPSSTWNGSTIGTIVKMSEKSSIWCIGSNKKCDVLSIGIISISIFAFLTIMYKYISFGSAKNSKKKKSMRRVIKYGDGTKKTQIIIKSYDRNKDLKPIINSVVRKKDPTINIYKLMQADPVPFINAFFLLIFFVYKKKLNYLEL
ncbi:hypothetical protein YYG_04469 [Plasmodium vinckei petteri]|uniref:PIR protein CIR protein n=1 Tax=Plasmodium vinckei petteri TaxID=138298 RepID=W7AFW3_PLAVN|nr:hypothetical protein YYG_04469 [Plasmodium vinckei petteri]